MGDLYLVLSALKLSTLDEWWCSHWTWWTTPCPWGFFPSCLKVMGGPWDFSVSPRPLLGLWVWGLGGWGLGVTINFILATFDTKQNEISSFFCLLMTFLLDHDRYMGKQLKLSISTLIIFSCEEAALEGQMSVCVCVCVSVWPQNWILPRLGCLKCTQNQLTVQGYTKPVYCTSVLFNNVHKTSLLVNNERKSVHKIN